MTTVLTLPALLKRNAERYGDGRTAIREKEYGIWQSVTWKAYYENVRDFALVLHRLGFQPGDKLAYAGDNRPEGFYTEITVQSLRGAVVGIYPDSHLEQVEYIINHSDAIFVVAGDQEQADKVLSAEHWGSAAKLRSGRASSAASPCSAAPSAPTTGDSMLLA